jgi:hypothetical protein
MIPMMTKELDFKNKRTLVIKSFFDFLIKKCYNIYNEKNKKERK